MPEKMAAKSSKNEMLIFGLRSTSDDWLSNESCLKCKEMATKSKNAFMFSPIYLRLSDHVTPPPPIPPSPAGKVGIRLSEKFWFFRIELDLVQPKDNSVQSLLHLLAMQLICDGQFTN